MTRLLQKSKKSKVFVCVFGEREKENLPRKCFKMPKFQFTFYLYFFSSRGSRGIHTKKMTFSVVSAPSKFFLFSLDFECVFEGIFGLLIELILVSLKQYGCLVSITLEKLKFQRSNQKLWPWEVRRRQSWHGFQDISTVLTLVSTHEYSLEKEFNNFHNGIDFNLFQWQDQNQGFWCPQESTLGQSWSKVTKITEQLKSKVET